MSRKTRTQRDNAKFAGIMQQFGISLTYDKGLLFFNAMADFFDPPVIREDAEKLRTGLDLIQDWLDSLEDNESVTVAAAAAIGDLDLSNRSTSSAVRKFLNGNDLLKHHPSSAENWTKQITHHKNGGNASQDAAAEIH